MKLKYLLIIASLSWPHQFFGQDPLPEHWVWSNGKLVLMPATINDPISPETKMAADNLHVRWKSSGNHLESSSSNLIKQSETEFNPYLSEIHPPTQSIILKNRPKRPEVIVPPIEKPIFREGDLPESNEATSLINSSKGNTNNIVNKVATPSKKNPEEIRVWGLQLQKRSEELKLRHSTLIKEKNPDIKKLKSYLLDSAQLKEELENYREAAGR